MLAAAAAMALLSTTPRVAFAGDAAAAEALFREGVDKLKKGDPAGACDALKGSNDLDPSPGTEINLGLCNEKQGKLASAWAWYRAAVGLAEQRGQKERADGARKDAERLEPQLHKLVIKVTTPPAGLVISRDGTKLPPQTYGAEVPVDPGPHKLEVSATGKKPLKVTVNTDASPGVQTWELPALEDGPVEQTAVTPTPGGETRPAEPPRSDGSTQRNIGLVVGGAGIVALLTGGVLQVVALSVNSDANKIDRDRKGPPDCTDKNTAGTTVVAGSTCDSLNSSYDQKKSAAKSDQLAAIITGAGGVVLIGVGVTLILTSSSRSSTASLTTPKVVPLLGAGQAGLGLMGAF
jgi:hypothetical protein